MADTAAADGTGWVGRLELRYRFDGRRTRAHDRHQGPLRVLQPLYPEGPAICQHVLVHPPGGVVGGDRLELDVHVEAGAHALVTTPGATRFYRSAGPRAHQQARLRLGAGARLEWLPLEAIAFAGCNAANAVAFELEAGAELIGWDLLALGLPAANAPFASGRFGQHLAWPGHWLEQATLTAADRLLLDGPLGLAGRTVVATMWWAGEPAPGLPVGAQVAAGEAVVEAARAVLAGDGGESGDVGAGGAGGDPRVVAGATALEPGLVVVRALAGRVEPVFALLGRVRAAWRALRWQLPATPPRIWRT